MTIVAASAFRSRRIAAVCAVNAACIAGAAHAQLPPDAAKLMDAQRKAMTALRPMDGVWRGTAITTLPSGERREVVQTERIGPFLQGTLKVIEGRGHDKDGQVAFNAFGIVSFDPRTGTYSMRSYAQGVAGDFPFTPTDDGYSWRIETPGATIRFVATIRAGELHEIGERTTDGKTVRFFEMHLTRIGDTSWPAGEPVPPR